MASIKGGKYKFCPACNQEREINRFHLDLDGITDENEEWDGYMPLCIPCCQLYPHGFPESPDGRTIRTIYQHQGGKCYHCSAELFGYYSVRPFIGQGKNGINVFKLVCSNCREASDMRIFFQHADANQQEYNNPLIDGM